MDMSSACTAPIQPTTTAADEAHPRYAEYRTYRSAMNRQMVTGLSLSAWLDRTLEKERGREVVFHTLPGAQIAQGWYKHKFAPRTERMTRFGPFATETEAQRA
jgi:hypothetical protein